MVNGDCFNGFPSISPVISFSFSVSKGLVIRLTLEVNRLSELPVVKCTVCTCFCSRRSSNPESRWHDHCYDCRLHVRHSFTTMIHVTHGKDSVIPDSARAFSFTLVHVSPPLPPFHCQGQSYELRLACGISVIVLHFARASRPAISRYITIVFMSVSVSVPMCLKTVLLSACLLTDVHLYRSFTAWCFQLICRVVLWWYHSRWGRILSCGFAVQEVLPPKGTALWMPLLLYKPKPEQVLR